MGHLLEVRDLITSFNTENGIVKAVDGVSFYLDEGEIIGIVGESGCGKSVTQLSVLQLIASPPGKIAGGEVFFEGVDLLKHKAQSEAMRSVRGRKIGMIFQEPMTSLNPVLTIGQQIIESLVLHLKLEASAARERAIELLKQVGIPDAENRVDHYPHQFSGGMRQRAMIAMTLCCHPKVLIADEATTALDVTTQAQLLELLRDTVRQFKTALVIVTHNLGVVARYAQRIYVMYAGRIVESGTAKEIFSQPRHPYTMGLLKAVPRLDEPKGRQLIPIVGVPPSLIGRPPTCAFLERCPRRIAQCEQEPWPKLDDVGGHQSVACFVARMDRPVDRQATSIFTQAADGSSLQGVRNAPAFTERPAGRMQDWVVQSEAPVRGRDGLNGPLLEVKALRMYFPVTRGLLRRKISDIKAVDGLSFDLKRGETLGLVGESGCGKTTTARCILRLYRPTSGQILLEGQDITALSRRRMRGFRRNMSLIFQDPYGSLDPRQTAGSIVGEPLKVHRLVTRKAEYDDRVAELFRMVGLDPGLADRVPHEFSGGQRQRIGIARALACKPSFIVCDEPISALDVSIQAQIINLLEELKHQLGLTFLFIGHDLSVVRHISDRVAVMYLGRIVEMTDCRSLYANPLHPYTKALLSAVPIPDPFVEEKRERLLLKGEVPSLINPPSGCTFHPRCPIAQPGCASQVPELRDMGAGHMVACSQL